MCSSISDWANKLQSGGLKLWQIFFTWNCGYLRKNVAQSSNFLDKETEARDRDLPKITWLVDQTFRIKPTSLIFVTGPFLECYIASCQMWGSNYLNFWLLYPINRPFWVSTMCLLLGPRISLIPWLDFDVTVLLFILLWLMLSSLSSVTLNRFVACLEL